MGERGGGDMTLLNRWGEYLDFWSGKRVLITGGAGFLGYRMAQVLKESLEVKLFGMDIKSWWNPHIPHEGPGSVYDEIRMRDVTDYRQCERAIVESKPDVIFHLAAISQVVDAGQMPWQAIHTNILGTANILEAARQTFPARIVTVVASSDKAYGSRPMRGTKIDELIEESFLRPIHPYDVSKASADLVARCYGEFYGEKVSVTRCGNIYGPGDDNYQRIVPGTIRSYLLGQSPLIRSDGTLVREYNFVDDIIEAYLMIAAAVVEGRADPGECWNISDYEGRMSVLGMVGQIGAAMRAASWGGRLLEPAILNEARGEGQEIRLSSMKIRDRLGWVPRTDLRSGLRATIAWVRMAHGIPISQLPEFPMVSRKSL